MAEKINDHVPTVSIGMPVYNGEKYIREALDSLLAQTFGDFELIISDNHSTDDTPNVCKEYAAKDSRIKYIRQAENIGANANFEFVLQQAIGEFFMWAACDDYLESNNYLSVMINTMKQGYDFCFPNVKILIQSVEKKTFVVGTMDGFYNCESIYDYCKQTVFTCSYQIYGMFQRNFLIENFKYIDQCKHFRCYGEGLFVHAVTANALSIYVPSVTLIYRRHEKNTSSTQKVNHLLVDLFRLSYKLLLFYFFYKKFNIIQRFMIIKGILYLHVKHALILVFPCIFKKLPI
jgi:glycosyltransferase involved in cell wall biosynthesis